MFHGIADNISYGLINSLAVHLERIIHTGQIGIGKLPALLLKIKAELRHQIGHKGFDRHDFHLEFQLVQIQLGKKEKIINQAI